MTLNRFRAFAVAAIGIAIILPSLSATTLASGTTQAPDIFTTLTGFTVLGNTGLVNVDPTPGSSFNVTYTEYVGADTNNDLCGIPGQCLTFIIDLSNAGPGSVERISGAGFGTFTTDVGFTLDSPFVGNAPFTVDKSADGAVVGFNFTTGPSIINSGQESARLEIMTSALFYTTGTVSIDGNGSGFGTGFAPASASNAPEPTSMLLMAAGLFGLGWTRWLRRATAGVYLDFRVRN